MKKQLPILLFFLSIAFLIPGISQPLLTIKATVDKQEMLTLATTALFPPDQSNNFVQNMLGSLLKQINVEGSVEVFESTRSLLETMTELIANDHVVVGLLIGLFGVIIPVVKIILILLSFFQKSLKNKIYLLQISGYLSKWSMSDVFVMAIIVAFLAINANEQAMHPVQMYAELGIGFYFFASYCLLAIAANQIMEKMTLKNA